MAPSNRWLGPDPPRTGGDLVQNVFDAGKCLFDLLLVSCHWSINDLGPVGLAKSGQVSARSGPGPATVRLRNKIWTYCSLAAKFRVCPGRRNSFFRLQCIVGLHISLAVSKRGSTLRSRSIFPSFLTKSSLPTIVSEIHGGVIRNCSMSAKFGNQKSGRGATDAWCRLRPGAQRVAWGLEACCSIGLQEACAAGGLHNILLCFARVCNI